MASGSLDAMLKIVPNKVGSPIKIEKVLNPKGGFPFFQVNGMNKDDLVTNTPQPQPVMPPVAVFQAPDTIPVMPPQTTTAPASNTDGSLTRLEQKIDQVLRLLTSVEESTPKEVELPF
jgi:hypothetical protein